MIAHFLVNQASCYIDSPVVIYLLKYSGEAIQRILIMTDLVVHQPKMMTATHEVFLDL